MKCRRHGSYSVKAKVISRLHIPSCKPVLTFETSQLKPSQRNSSLKGKLWDKHEEQLTMGFIETAHFLVQTAKNMKMHTHKSKATYENLGLFSVHQYICVCDYIKCIKEICSHSLMFQPREEQNVGSVCKEWRIQNKVKAYSNHCLEQKQNSDIII